MSAPEGPSRFAKALTWIAVTLSVVMVAVAIAKYGLTLEVQKRFWADIVARASGPMTFRFYLQPTMAAIAALHDGLNDTRRGHHAFFWTALWDPSQRSGRLREGFIATARILLLGLCMDTIYQFKVLDQFYPAEAVMISFLLAVLPYFVFRWIVERVSRWWFARRSHGSAA